MTRDLGAAVLLALLTLAAYRPLADAGFFWDDRHFVERNEALTSVDGLRRIWTDPDVVKQYYPVTVTSFWLEYQAWGLDPGGYHVVNVVLQLANSLLLWAALRSLAFPGAWAAAFLFCLHPVQVETVGWITERKNTLSLLLFLLALLSYIRSAGLGRPRPGNDAAPPAASDAGRWSGIGWYLLCVVLFALAVLSKTVTCTFGALILILHWWKRAPLTRGVVLRIVPLLLLGAALGLNTAHVEQEVAGASGAQWEWHPLERILIASRIWWFYLTKLVWPAPLIFFYERWEIARDSAAPYGYPLALAALGAGLWGLRRRVPREIPAFLAYYSVAIFPALGFFNVYAMRFAYVADHFSYHALVGPCALLGWGWWRLTRGAGRARTIIAVAVAAALLGAMTIRTHQRSIVFQSAERVWRDTIEKNPDAWAARVNLSEIVLQRGDIAEGLAQLREAVRLYPDEPVNQQNLAWLLATLPDDALRDGDAALAHATRACKLTNYGDPISLDVLGAALAETGSFDDAIDISARARRIAEKLGRRRLADEIRERIALYRRGRAYRLGE